MFRVSRKTFEEIEKALDRHREARRRFREERERGLSRAELDAAFYKYIQEWLSLDDFVDGRLNAHTIRPWMDPDLQPIRDGALTIETKLTKLEDRNEKGKIIREIVERLDEIIEKLP